MLISSKMLLFKNHEKVKKNKPSTAALHLLNEKVKYELHVARDILVIVSAFPLKFMNITMWKGGI